jgi:hypothetical protein
VRYLKWIFTQASILEWATVFKEIARCSSDHLNGFSEEFSDRNRYDEGKNFHGQFFSNPTNRFLDNISIVKFNKDLQLMLL